MRPDPTDVHLPYVHQLEVTSDWDGLVRYWLAHQYAPALEAAIGLARKRAKEQGGRWIALAQILADVQENPFDMDEQAVEDQLPAWPHATHPTLCLTILYPRLVLCELAAQLPIERRDQLYKDGLQAAEQAIELADTLQDSAMVAFVCALRARALMEQRELEAARDSYRKALALYRELERQRPNVYGPDVARTLNNLGIIEHDQNVLETAQDRYLEALCRYRELARQKPDVYQPNAAGTLNNLGMVQSALNALESARDSYQESVTLYRELERQHPDVYKPSVATTLNNLGVIEHKLNDGEKARLSLQEALAIRRKLVRQNPDVYRSDVAATVHNLGMVQGALNAPEAARDSYQEALDLYRILEKQRPNIYKSQLADTLNNLGLLLSASNALQEARDKFQEAADLYDADALARPTAHLIARRSCWYNLGEIYLRNNASLGWPNVQGARAALRRANDCTEQIRDLFVDPRQRQRVQTEAMYIAEALVCTCVHIGEHSQDTSPLREAVEVTEASRARNLMELLSDETLHPANAPSRLVDEFRQLRRRLRQTEYALQHKQGARDGSAADHADNLRRQYETVLQEIHEHDAEFNPDKPMTPVKFEDIIELLPDDIPTAVVQYNLTYADGLALLITRTDTQAVRLPELDDRHMTELASAWFVAHQYYIIRNDQHSPNRMRRAENALRAAVAEYQGSFGRSSARALEELLASVPTWDEALPVLLSKVAKCAVVPVVEALAKRGIELHRVEDAQDESAAPDSGRRPRKAIGRLILSPNRGLHVFPLHACILADGRYLADACEVVYTPSLSILHRCASRERTERSRLCLVENPTCDLPFTELEGALLRQRYQNCDWLYGSGATKETIFEQSRDCHVLAYTGHARFDPRDPLNSALVLESATAPERWLTLRDIFTGMHLRQNLLTVINGCESGIVLPDRVDEYVGLPSGFLYAGAVCVLSTLWAVDDLSSALLMDRFHKEWQLGKSIAAALHDAQRWLRDDIKNGPYLRDRVLPDLLVSLDDDGPKQKCQRQAEDLAARFPDRPPFTSPVHWGPFVTTGLSYPLSPGHRHGQAVKMESHG